MPLPKIPNRLSDKCLDFIERVPRCTVPRLPYELQFEPLCADFVSDNTGYNVCIDTHKNDPDFYHNDWRIYLGLSAELWKEKREVIKLVDAQGGVVDVITY